VTTSSRFSAFLAYLLLVIGWLIVFLFHRDNKFAMYHTKQAVVLVLAALGVPLVWGVAGWMLSLLPYFGIIGAVALFALVIATELLLFVAWIVGMIYAWQGAAKPLPFVGMWAGRLFG
jgi:uncharacterized membrane protein